MLKYWYKEFPQFPASHRDYWRVRFVFHCLLITNILFLVLAIINFQYFNDFEYGLLDSAGFLLSATGYWMFTKYQNIAAAAGLFCVILTAIIVTFLLMIGGYAHSLMWATIVPPFTFFLTGKKWGTIYSLITFGVCIYVVYGQTQSDVAKLFSTGSLLNVIEVCIAHILLFRFYERSRSAAYNELAKQKSEVELLAQTDSLTRLYNRDKFNQELQNLAATASTNNPYSILLIDVDHFKQINDLHGHLVGDEVLKALATRLKVHTSANNILARWGGEEFSIILPNTNSTNAMIYAQRICELVANQPIQGIGVTISIGVTTVSNNGSISNALKLADKALYRAKAEGRNRSVALH